MWSTRHVGAGKKIVNTFVHIFNSRKYIRKATPVIGDVAMETITETVITESAMIGHNPATPGGQGMGMGTTIAWDQIASAAPEEKWILVVPETVDFRGSGRRHQQIHGSGQADRRRHHPE